MRMLNFSKIALIASIAIVLTGCSATNISETKDYSGELFTVKADASDKIDLQYRDRSKCFWHCNTLFPTRFDRSFYCGNRGCKFEAFHLTYDGERNKVLEGTKILYNVNKQELVDGNIQKITLQPNSRTVIEYVGIFGGKLEAMDADPNEFLQSPHVANIDLGSPIEIISKYNQESIVGNLARLKYLDSHTVKQVQNVYPICFDYPDYSFNAKIKTFAYRNGTRVVVSDFYIVFKKDNALISKELDLRTYKSKFINELKKVIKD